MIRLKDLPWGPRTPTRSMDKWLMAQVQRPDGLWVFIEYDPTISPPEYHVYTDTQRYDGDLTLNHTHTGRLCALEATCLIHHLLTNGEDPPS